MTMRAARMIALPLCLFTYSACSGGDGGTPSQPTPKPVAAVTVSPAGQTLTVGGTAQLSATTLDNTGTVLTGRTVVWTTGNSTLATVSGTGLVTGVAAGGPVTITATTEGKSGTAAVTVTASPVATVAVTLNTPTLAAGLSTTVSVSLRDAAGTLLTDRVVTLSSSNQSVATSDLAGTVSALAAGTSTITATSEGKTGTATLSVTTGAVGTAPVATAVGATNGAAATAIIGPAGGTVASTDGRLTLTVPASALATAITISIQPITNLAPGGSGDGYRLLPDGQQFQLPVQLMFRYAAIELAGTFSDALGVSYQDAQRYWQLLPTGTFSATNGTLTVSITHFTDWVTVHGLQLLPGQGAVAVTKTLGLSSVFCSRVPRVGTTVRLAACQSGGVLPNSWAVNSIVGGNSATVGTAFGSSVGGVYTAPARTPSSNPVAVSATVDPTLYPGTQVVSNILVFEDSWSGITNSFDIPISTDAQVKWVLESNINGVATYKATGTVNVQYDGCSVNPSSHAIDPNRGYLIIDFNASPATYRAAGVDTWPSVITCTPALPNPNINAVAAWLKRGAGEATGVVTDVGGVSTITGGDLINTWTFRRDH